MAASVDVNELINGLLEEISQQAKEIAMLKVQLNIVSRQLDVKEPGGDVKDGDE